MDFDGSLSRVLACVFLYASSSPFGSTDFWFNTFSMPFLMFGCCVRWLCSCVLWVRSCRYVRKRTCCRMSHRFTALRCLFVCFDICLVVHSIGKSIHALLCLALCDLYIRIAHICLSVLKALVYMHTTKKTIHRDIKVCVFSFPQTHFSLESFVLERIFLSFFFSASLLLMLRSFVNWKMKCKNG